MPHNSFSILALAWCFQLSGNPKRHPNPGTKARSWPQRKSRDLKLIFRNISVLCPAPHLVKLIYLWAPWEDECGARRGHPPLSQGSVSSKSGVCSGAPSLQYGHLQFAPSFMKLHMEMPGKPGKDTSYNDLFSFLLLRIWFLSVCSGLCHLARAGFI